MKQPTPEQLAPLLASIDVACWAWAVQKGTKNGQSCKVDWKSALDELQVAWSAYLQAAMDKEFAWHESKSEVPK